MRIALVTDGIYPYVIGGMQKHSYYLCKYLAQQGVHVDLYHTNQSELDIQSLELFSKEEKNYISSIVIPFPVSDKMLGHYLRSSYKYAIEVYKRYVKRAPVDFIYAKGFSGWHMAKEKKSNNIKVPLAVNFHGYEMFQPAPSFKSKLEQILLFKSPVKYICDAADYVFSYGSKVTDVITSIPIPANKIIEIPTGIEAAWLNPTIQPAGTKRKFLFIGRYERRKGIQELTEAIGKLKDSNFEFHFIGPIPVDKQLKNPAVIYHGSIHNQDEIKKISQSCDVLVCPSYSEGMPNVIMEGMASGLAIIATNVGAVNLMVDSTNGILMEVNELSNLHQKIEALCTMNADQLNSMKRNSIEKVKQQFLWTHIAQQHITFFEKCIV